MVTAKEYPRYTLVAAALHWTIAALILVNVAIGWSFPGAVAGQGFSPKPLLPLHVTIGLLVLLLSIGRLAWRLGHRPPPFSPGMLIVERRLAYTAHVAFYVLMLAMPFTGWLVLSAHKIQKGQLHPFGAPWPHFPIFPDLPAGTVLQLHDALVTTHSLLALWLLPAMLTLHVSGAVKHHLFDADPVLLRMLPRRVQSKIDERSLP